MNPLGWRLAAASLLNLASSQPGWSADWNRDTQNEYGGTYSTNCNNPAAPRVRAVSQGLLVEVGTQRMTGTNLQVAVALFGNQGEPPGQQTVALMSQVRGRFEMNFNVHRDTSGQWGALEGDPKVIAAIGNGLAAQRFRDCDASRSARAAAQMQGDLRQARADKAATRVAARQPDAVRFKTALRHALGAKMNEKWVLPMIGMPGADTPTLKLGGTVYQEITACKPHDCYDNNLLLLYEPDSGAVYGKVVMKTVPSVVGGPPPALASEIEKRWRVHWRSGQ
jgi:hypothetical protein